MHEYIYIYILGTTYIRIIMNQTYIKVKIYN